MLDDIPLRLAAFAFLKAYDSHFQGVFPFVFLRDNFEYKGRKVPLVSVPGIWKGDAFRLPISIRTAMGGPYPDGVDENNLISYSYRGTDIGHPDNVGLREAMRQKTPLIYFKGVQNGYTATWPVYIVGDEPRRLTFSAMADDPAVLREPKLILAETTPIRRAYVTANVQKRVHQAAFRERVLDAYREHCSLCRLKHRELLDAAHIIADSEEKGEPVVSNGLSMCKLHHAAFDNHIIGISPDYVIEVRQDVLDEQDGPMLKHGLQEMQGVNLYVPKEKSLQPSRDGLAQRFADFRFR